MNLKDLTILKRRYDPHIDAYLVLGRRKEKDVLRRYVVGWYSRHKDTKLARRKSFLDFDSAKISFQDMTKITDPPVHKSFVRDWQVQKVYRWEEKYLEEKAVTINETQARQLIAKVCTDYGIKKPELIWRKRKTEHSDYCVDNHRIRFGHRDNVALLHELAHALHAHKLDVHAHHSPPFVWIAMELYNRYAGCNLSYLVTTAQQAGLLGDLDLQKSREIHGYAKTPALKHG